LEEVLEERRVFVDHTSVFRWVIRFTPLLLAAFKKRKAPVGKRWRMDQTYVKVKGQDRYLYRAVDKAGDTVDFLLTAHRDRDAARRFLEKSTSRTACLRWSTSTRAAPTRPASRTSTTLTMGP
jgi:transposase-like protein